MRGDGLVGGFLLGDFEDAAFAAVEDGGGGIAGFVAVASVVVQAVIRLRSIAFSLTMAA